MFRRTLQVEFLKRATLALLAVSVFALSLELPTPVTVQKDQTVAFPCQSRPCGCQNADDCWASCCCFSDPQKLAWAQANNVTPPAWFMDKVQSEGIVASPTNPEQSATTCCCCHQAEETATNEAQGPRAPSSGTDSKLIRITLKQHLGCQGQRELLKKQIVFVAGAPFQTTPRPTNKFLRSPSATATTLAIDPPTPPPRRRHAAATVSQHFGRLDGAYSTTFFRDAILCFVVKHWDRRKDSQPLIRGFAMIIRLRGSSAFSSDGHTD